MKKSIFYSMVLLALVACGGGGSTGEEEGEVTGGGVVESSDSAETSDALSAEEKSFLKAINEAREKDQRCGDTEMKAVDDLVWSKKLAQSAQYHSEDMAGNNYRQEDKNDPTVLMTNVDTGDIEEVVSIERHGIVHETMHVGSGTSLDISVKDNDKYDKSTFIERIGYVGYSYSAISENITAGTNVDTAEKAVENWLNSESHCKNLMSPEFTEVGMAVKYDENSFYKYYWTQNFGKPKN